MSSHGVNLVKELRAARRSIRLMKSQFNRFDEGYAVGNAALRRINKVLKPMALPGGAGEPNPVDARQLSLQID